MAKNEFFLLRMVFCMVSMFLEIIWIESFYDRVVFLLRSLVIGIFKIFFVLVYGFMKYNDLFMFVKFCNYFLIF